MGDITWTLRTFNLDELTDFYKNPRSLSKDQYDQLKTSLDKFGMIDKPIINADAVHTVIGGHQRLHVLRAERVKAVECWSVLGAELSGRKARAIEMAPEYIAVILERWSILTGLTPELYSEESVNG